jgi:hypothetical protein
VNDDDIASVTSTLDTAVLAMAFIDEDTEAGLAVIKHAEIDDLLHIIGSLVSLITDHLGDDGARDYFEAVRKSMAAYEATGNARMRSMRDYVEDDGLTEVADDAVGLIETSLRCHDMDAHIERVLKWASPAAVIAELASAAAVLASRFGEDDWYTAARAASRAARLS